MGWEIIDFLFVLQIGMTVKVAKKGSVDPIRISIFKQIPFFFCPQECMHGQKFCSCVTFEN